MGLLYRTSLAVALASTLAGCHEPEDQNSFQGLVEYDAPVLAFELGGRVERLLVTRGAAITAGQPLAALDQRLGEMTISARRADAAAARARVDLLRAGSRSGDVVAMRAQIRAAKAEEELLAKRVDRHRTLFAAGSIPEELLDEAVARLASQAARREALEGQLTELLRGARREELENAQAIAAASTTAVALETERLKRHTLFAPANGTVLETHVDIGEVVAAGSPVVTIADTSHPYVDVFVPQGQLADLRIGTPAQVRIDAADHSFAARVEDVAQRTEFTPRFLFSDRERATLVVRVRIRIDDPQRALFGGVPAFVTVDRGANPTLLSEKRRPR